MISPATEKIIKQLKKQNLSLEDKTALTAALLDKISALPLRNSIVLAPGMVTINGKALDTEQAVVFKDSCIALQDNFARKVIHEQIRYLAVNWGVHNGLNTEMIMFSKAALWTLEEEQKLLDKLT